MSATAPTPTAAEAPAPDQRPRDVGLDGEKIKDMEYYDVLGVRADATDIELKKAYRRQALLYHPDKNPGNAEAEAKFVAVSKAMQILSDPQERAWYNKNGKRNNKLPGGMDMEDPGKLFANMFGGDKFKDWIGEISLGKDIGKAFEVSTTEEEREQLKAEWASKSGANTPRQEAISHTSHLGEPSTASASGSIPGTPVNRAGSPRPDSTLGSGTGEATSAAAAKSAGTKRMTPEQKAEMEKYERQRREEQARRVYNLTVSLINRLRPYVEAQKALKSTSVPYSSPQISRFGRNRDRSREEKEAAEKVNEENEEVKRWEKSIRIEAEDLKLESFGVELLRLIGSVYFNKASSYIKLHRPKSPFANFLGLPGFLESTKQKGKVIKEAWGMLSSTLDVQAAMQDLEKRQEKGELPEDEMEALNKDLMGKLLLVSWKGTRFESGAVLRQVVDNVLSRYPLIPPTPSESGDSTPNPPTPMPQPQELVDQETLMFRAKGLLLIGAVFKSVEPDETDEERRELEKLVAEAAKKKERPGATKKAASPTDTPKA